MGYTGGTHFQVGKKSRGTQGVHTLNRAFRTQIRGNVYPVYPLLSLSIGSLRARAMRARAEFATPRFRGTRVHTPDFVRKKRLGCVPPWGNVANQAIRIWSF